MPSHAHGQYIQQDDVAFYRITWISCSLRKLTSVQLTDSQTWVGQGSCAVLVVAVMDNDECLQPHGMEEVLLLVVTMTTGVCQLVL